MCLTLQQIEMLALQPEIVFNEKAICTLDDDLPRGSIVVSE